MSPCRFRMRLFDVVLSFDVFEHIPDSDAHLAEVRGCSGRAVRTLIKRRTSGPMWSSRRFAGEASPGFVEITVRFTRSGELTRRLARHGFTSRAYESRS